MNETSGPSGASPAGVEAPGKDEVDEETAGGARASAEDLALVQRLLAGDGAAFASLVDCYHARLLRLAMTFVSDRSAAEEVVQDTWLGVINGLAAFEGRSALKTWIFRILTNRAKTRGVREAHSMPFSSLGNPNNEDEPAVDPSRFLPNGMWADPPRRWDDETPEKLLIRQDAMRRIEEELAKLPPNQRAVLTLRDVEGLDSDEVCSILEISETNQRVLLHRARSKIRHALEEYLGGV
jgi:RNA polymerase sigma-70 factor (ECF subfamily)